MTQRGATRLSGLADVLDRAKHMQVNAVTAHQLVREALEFLAEPNKDFDVRDWIVSARRYLDRVEGHTR